MSPFGGQAVEGAFAFQQRNPGDPSRAPFTSMPTGGAHALVCGAGGVAIGRFAWAHPDGRVTNERVDAAQDRLGVAVLAKLAWAANDWRRNFWDRTTRTWRAREGTEITLITRGALWARFAGGAWPGQPVYASILDGQAFSGYADDAMLTDWSVQTSAAPGELAIITTQAFFTP